MAGQIRQEIDRASAIFRQGRDQGARMTPTHRPEGFWGRPRAPDKILGDKMAAGVGVKSSAPVGAIILTPPHARSCFRPGSCLEPGGGSINSPGGGWGSSGEPVC